MNDTPQGDGNAISCIHRIRSFTDINIRMNDTPQGDGNLASGSTIAISIKIRMNDTPQGDGNKLLKAD